MKTNITKYILAVMAILLSFTAAFASRSLNETKNSSIPKADRVCLEKVSPKIIISGIATKMEFIGVISSKDSSMTLKKSRRSKKDNGRMDQIWYFNGTSGAEILNASKWSTTNPNMSGCGLGSQLPCNITVPATSQTELQDFLNNYSAEDVTDMANSRRNPN